MSSSLEINHLLGLENTSKSDIEKIIEFPDEFIFQFLLGGIYYNWNRKDDAIKCSRNKSYILNYS